MRTHKLFATLLILFSYSLQAATIQGKVVSVSDGDTIKVLDATNTQHKIRLQGIDAPEKTQPFGQKSKILNGTDVCLEQIKLGMAWHYKQYKSDQPKEDRETYAQAELEARTKTVGIWTDKNPTPPWEFRKQKSSAR